MGRVPSPPPLLPRPPVSFLSSSSEVWVSATWPEWRCLSQPLPLILTMEMLGAGGVGNALDLGKALQGSGSICCWSNRRDFIFFYSHFWYRNKEQQQQQQQNHSFRVITVLRPWTSFFSATPRLTPRVLRQAKDFLLLCHLILPIYSGKAKQNFFSWPSSPFPFFLI